MADWQETIERLLARDEAPPVLTRDLLKRYSGAANDSRPVPPSSLTYWVAAMVRKQTLLPVQRGLFLNAFRKRRATLADACFWYHPDAVVSLNTVLGDAGVLNNPTAVVTAVVPIDTRASPPSRLGRKTTKLGVIHFFGMPRHVLEAGDPDDRLDTTGRYEHLRATPERALVDWLYLGLSPRSRKTLPPRLDIDMEPLNKSRLARLASAINLGAEIRTWARGGS